MNELPTAYRIAAVFAWLRILRDYRSAQRANTLPSRRPAPIPQYHNA